MRRIRIDLNRRNSAGQTPASYTGPAPEVGEQVIAYEPEDGVRVDAFVAAVKPARSMVVLDVRWDTIATDTIESWSRPRGEVWSLVAAQAPATATTGGDLLHVEFTGPGRGLLQRAAG